MRGFIIDPAGQSIDEIAFNGALELVNALIDAESVTSKRVGAGLFAFVDADQDRPARNCLWSLDSFPSRLAGKSLILGRDERGYSHDAPTTLADLRRRVTFEDGFT